jgi:hypothetical protein
MHFVLRMSAPVVAEEGNGQLHEPAAAQVPGDINKDCRRAGTEPRLEGINPVHRGHAKRGVNDRGINRKNRAHDLGIFSRCSGETLCAITRS